MAMIKNDAETAASVTIGALGYRARCTEAGCGNLARLGLRHADTGGRPIAHPVVCHAHARLKLAAMARSGAIGAVRSGGNPGGGGARRSSHKSAVKNGIER